MKADALHSIAQHSTAHALVPSYYHPYIHVSIPSIYLKTISSALVKNFLGTRFALTFLLPVASSPLLDPFLKFAQSIS